MKMPKLVVAVALLAAAAGLSACSPSASDGPVIAPVTMSADELQGESVELIVGQVLNINTGDLAVDSYTAEIADTSVAEFTQGREDGSATFNPGVTARSTGSTEVVLTNQDGGIQPVTFTVDVVENPN
ncbi:hypothetical protein AB1K54_12640 [Microbacterium sp. BWT-B31]|uniref:hypothetical protein n=1 Tax=Microbacterium sp. BWT-B31 TaxID=3232072 RepID=UPI003529CDF4